MRNYIQWLLQEEDTKEEGMIPTWEEGGVLQAAAAPSQPEGESVVQAEGISVAKSLPWKQLSWEKWLPTKSALWRGLEPEGERAAYPVQKSHPERTELSSESLLWERLQAGELALPSLGQRSPTTATAGTEGAVPLLAVETLDRLVEQDARRYDHGFTLY